LTWELINLDLKRDTITNQEGQLIFSKNVTGEAYPDIYLFTEAEKEIKTYQVWEKGSGFHQTKH